VARERGKINTYSFWWEGGLKEDLCFDRRIILKRMLRKTLRDFGLDFSS
jgi:hypothetical protein